MEGRVKEAILNKIDETLSNVEEISGIVESLSQIPVKSKNDLAFGIAIGRIYNSFHYQTRRALNRNATQEEFRDFLDILSIRAPHIRKALKQQ